MRDEVFLINPKQWKQEVVSGTGLDIVGIVSKTFPDSKYILCLTDKRVASLYPDTIKGLQGMGSELLIIPQGEGQKSLSRLEWVIDALAYRTFTRDSLFIALGGGVIGDIGGLAASLYMRGMNLILIPTTLLSMVDSAYGGKTAINLKYGKNLVGTFYPAQLIIVDTVFLSTLPPEEWVNGLAEVVKYGIGFDAGLFEELEAYVATGKPWQEGDWEEWIPRCYRIKLDIVRDDLHEGGKRILLNIGHTIGHALEKWGGYKLYSHGEAVFFGMKAEIEMSRKEGYLSDIDYNRITALLDATAPVLSPLPPSIDELLPLLQWDKKRREGRGVIMPVVKGVGKGEVEEGSKD